MYQDYKNVELVKPAGLDLKDRLVGVQRVTKVTKGSVAKLAGLQESDLIIQAAGKKISTAEEFVEIVGNQSPGTYLPLLILRNGEEVVIIAKFPPLSNGNNRR